MSQLSEVAQPEGTLLAAQDADAVAGTVDVIRKLTCVKQRVQRNRLLFHEFSRDDARSLCSEKLNTPTAAHGTERLIHDRLIAFALSHWLVAFSDCWPCPPNRAFRLTPSLLAAFTGLTRFKERARPPRACYYEAFDAQLRPGIYPTLFV